MTTETHTAVGPGYSPLLLPAICTAAAFGGIMYGMDTGLISGTLPQVKRQFELTAHAEGLLVSSTLIGAIIGIGGGGLLGDLFGRRPMMLLSALLILASALGCSFANDAAMLTAARFIGGLGVGVTGIIAPLYIAEMSPAKHRGALLTIYHTALSVGLVCAQLSSTIIVWNTESIFSLGLLSVWREEHWRLMFLTLCIPTLICLWIALVLPESARWLAKEGRWSEAREVLGRFTQPSEAQQVIAGLEATIEGERRHGRVSFLTLLKGENRRAVLLTVFMNVFNALSGITLILYYGATMLDSVGVGMKGALGGAFILAVVFVVAHLPTFLYIDSVGRRKLLLWGVIALVVVQFSVGLALNAGMTDFWVLVPLLCAFVGIYAATLGPIHVIVPSELFPNAVRGRGVAVAGMASAITAALLNQLFPLFRDSFGLAVAFFAFSVALLPLIPFALWFLPETKRKTLEQIEVQLREDFDKDASPRVADEKRS